MSDLQQLRGEHSDASGSTAASSCGPAGGYEIRGDRLYTNTVNGDLNGVPLRIVPTPPALPRALAQMRTALPSRCPPRLIVVDTLGGKLGTHTTPALLLVSTKEARQYSLRLLQVFDRAAVAQLLGADAPRDPIGLVEALRDELMALVVANGYGHMLARDGRETPFRDKNSQEAAEFLAGRLDRARRAGSVLGVLLRVMMVDAAELEPRVLAYLSGFLGQRSAARDCA